jgi:hypothetical protein
MVLLNLLKEKVPRDLSYRLCIASSQESFSDFVTYQILKGYHSSALVQSFPDDNISNLTLDPAAQGLSESIEPNSTLDWELAT